MEKDNAAQEIAEDLLTDPDKDAAKNPPPAPPQTIDAEPSGAGASDR
ncbi:hypothetical protein [Sphingomonas sp.]|jgi:hypothetical protein|nr:hypothetical protein [Sphingomonas sp.]HEU0042969.1 hypothetical protein [Sphingomonas sp.]